MAITHNFTSGVADDLDPNEVGPDEWNADHDIDDETITNAMLAHIAEARIKGRAAGAGTGDATDLTAAQVAAIVESAIDHGSIAGLGDDDHTQYALRSILTTLGDIIYAGASAVWTRLAGNTTTTKQYLSQTGDGAISAAPTWAQIDHGADLAGLTDDDHTQYVLADGTRSMDALTVDGEVNVGATPGAGTSGQVLTSQGDNTPPEWDDAAGGGFTPLTPGGRLTLTTGTPVLSTEAANQTTVYYTPYVHDGVPIYNGTDTWTMTTFAELSMAMAASANWVADSNYDLYVINDSGTLRLATGTVWTNGTTRSTGLTLQNGIYVNTSTQTMRYGAASTVSVTALTGTYVGTMRTTATTGTTTMEFGGEATGGDPVFLYLWNKYNRVPMGLHVFDATDTWTYTNATWRSSNGSTSNRITLLMGLDEEGVMVANAQIAANASGSWFGTGIGLDGTTSPTAGTAFLYDTAAGLRQGYGAIGALRPGIGVHFLQAVERSQAVGTRIFYGDGGGTDLQTGLGILTTI